MRGSMLFSRPVEGGLFRNGAGVNAMQSVPQLSDVKQHRMRSTEIKAPAVRMGRLTSYSTRPLGEGLEALSWQVNCRATILSRLP